MLVTQAVSKKLYILISCTKKARPGAGTRLLLENTQAGNMPKIFFYCQNPSAPTAKIDKALFFFSKALFFQVLDDKKQHQQTLLLQTSASIP